MNMREDQGNFFARGDIVDRELFGEVLVEEYKKQYGEQTRLNFEEALDAVKTFQPYRPEAPTIQFAKELRVKIVELCEKDDVETSRDVFRFYTAAGGKDVHADKLGVDGFIEQVRKHPYGNEFKRATFDIKTYTTDKMLRADVIISVPQEGYDTNNEEEQRLFQEKILETAVQATDILKHCPWKTEQKTYSYQRWGKNSGVNFKNYEFD